MLIIESKCISSFSSKVILSDVCYHNYHHYLHWQISCKSVTMATRQHDLSFACLKSDWRAIFSCARSFSTLRVQVVLRRSFCYFHPAQFSYCCQNSSPKIILCGKLWQRDRINITGLNEWCRQTKTNPLDWNRTCWYKLPSFLNSVPFLQQCSKVLTEKNAFPTAKHFLDFFSIFIVKFSFYIIYNLK